LRARPRRGDEPGLLAVRTSVASFLDDFRTRGGTAFVHRRGLRLARWSYGELAETSARFARELETRGVGRGDRVVIWGEGSPEWIAVLFGCLLRGAVAVPLDRQSTPDFVSRVVEQVEPRLIAADSTLSPVAGNKARLDLDTLVGLVSRHVPNPYPPEPSDRSDTAEILFTSGTTATPKGVRITHGNLLSNLEPLEREIAKYLKWERPFHPIRFLNLLPLSHIFGQFMGIFVPQLLGGEVHLADALSPSEIVETVRTNRISVVAAVPRVLQGLRAKIERDAKATSLTSDLEAAAGWGPAKRWWRFRRIHREFGMKFWAFVSGGATLDEETEVFWRRLGFAVVQGYGMTETASLISVNHPFKMSHGSIGKVLPGQEVKLDASGEILVRGANVTPGYWRTDTSSENEDDGWFHTGDVGALDGEGNLFFKGRKKDVIVTAAGMNVHPEDLEAALDLQPCVRASVVVGLEGPNGPEPVAALILEDDSADPASAVAAANGRLASHQEIRRWVVWPELDFPRTSTSKVRRQDVAESVRAMLSGGAAKRSPLAELIGRVTGGDVARVDPNATLGGDLDLDSLARVELMSAIEERYQVDVDEAAFTAATTLADVERLIERGGGGAGSVTYSYPYWTRSLPLKLLRWVVFYAVTLPVTRVMCWVRACGVTTPQGLEGPVLFVSNHVASADAVLIMSALPGRYRRRLAIAMSGEMLAGYRNPSSSFGLLARLVERTKYLLVVALFNVFPLPQRSGFRRSFEYAGELVDEGYSVLLFPEGARTPDGRIHPFQVGVGVLASRLDIPVVPVRIDNLHDAKVRGQRVLRPGAVTVSFGEAVRYGANDDPQTIARELERRVREA
jgi:long-chain acyl-CoA synthetase